MALNLNLNALANSATQAVNPNVLVTITRSTGYTTEADGTRTPTTTVFKDVPANIQAISGGRGADGPMLQHLDSLGIQGTLRAFWINMDVQGVNRTTNKGGDLIGVPATLLFPPAVYLASQVIEAWDEGGWCHVIGQLQTDQP